MADPGGAEKRLVAEVVALVGEGLEVAQMALEGRGVQGHWQAAQDLLHGEEATVIAKDGWPSVKPNSR